MSKSQFVALTPPKFNSELALLKAMVGKEGSDPAAPIGARGFANLSWASTRC